MEKQDPSTELQDAIKALELRRDQELYLLKEQLHATYESLSPLSMVKNALQKVSESQQVRKSLADILISAASGYVTKKVVVGASKSPIRKVLGAVVQNEVTNLVSRNADTIQWSVLNLLTGLFNKRKKALG